MRETSLTSPADGEIKTVVGELGEIVRPGQTVVTIVPRGRPWFTFTIREDSLGDIAIGATTELMRSDGKTTPARVVELRPLGDFATWQATRAIGDHDLNSFFVRLDPVSDDDNDLEPRHVGLARRQIRQTRLTPPSGGPSSCCGRSPPAQ